MRNANKPVGPGNPLKELTDAVAQQEGVDELEADASGAPLDGDPALPDPVASARHAARGAHTKRDADNGKN